MEGNHLMAVTSVTLKNTMQLHILISLLWASTQSLLILNRTESDPITQEHLKSYLRKLRLGKTSCIMLIDLRKQRCSNCIEHFLHRFVNIPKIIDSGDMPAEDDIPNPTHTFLFVENAAQMKSFLRSSHKYELYSVRSRFQFIFCLKVLRNQWINRTLKYVWNKGVFNFVLVYVFYSLEKVSYNDFHDVKVMNLTTKRALSRILFPDKTKNLKGRELEVGVYEEFPKIKKIGEKWDGEDIRILTNIIGMSNATLKIKELPRPKNFYDISEMMGDSTEFRFIRRSLHFGYEKLIYVQPFRMDSLVAFVPRSHVKLKHLASFFSIYNASSAAAMVLLIIVVAFVVEASRDMSFFAAAYWASYLFGTCVKNLRNKSNSTKIVFLSWTVFGLINGVVLQTTLTTMLLRREHDPEIDTIEQLRDSNMTIYIDLGHLNLVPKILLAQCVFSNSTDIYQKFMDDTQAEDVYVFLESSINAIKRETSTKASSFRVMKETLVPGFTVYLFHRQSPWYDMVNNNFRAMFDYVYLNRYQFTVRRSRKRRQRRQLDLDSQSLTFHHWKSIFSAILVCYLVTFIVFIGELMWKYTKNNYFKYIWTYESLKHAIFSFLLLTFIYLFELKVLDIR
nr:unnamed protein product [Callosobruchus analis]